MKKRFFLVSTTKRGGGVNPPNHYAKTTFFIKDKIDEKNITMVPGGGVAALSGPTT